VNVVPPASFRLAVAQPRIDRSMSEESRVDDAVATIAQAGREGAELVLFPESYPGPISAGCDYDAAPAIAEAAGNAGCGVCWGRVEHGEDGRLRTVAFLLNAQGAEQLRYVRSHPATGDVHTILSGGPMAPGDRLGLGQIAGVRFGVAICSELWIPEISRSLALSGAEIILAPAGGAFHRVASNWRLIARARAIENNCHVALTQQLFDGEAGAALIAGPERVEVESTGEGLILATLDLERSRWLASADDSMNEPKPFDSLPGLLRARRPELYGALVSERENLYDYEGKSRGKSP
jgi:predicted amidohydrolase